MRYWVCFYLLFGINQLYAQTLADSIIQKYQGSADTIKVSNYIEVAARIQNKDYANCIKLCDEAIRIANNINRPDFIAHAHFLKGLTSYFAGEYDATLQYYLTAIKQFDSLNNNAGKASVYNELGFFYRKQHNDTAALNSFKEAFRLAQIDHDEAVMATAINNQGVWAQDHGNHTIALSLFSQAQTYYVALKDSIGISYTLDYASVSYAAQKNFIKAVQFQTESYFIRLRMKDTNAAALSLFCLGEFALLQHNQPAAIRYFTDCKAITEKIKYKELTAQCYLQLAKIMNESGNPTLAYTYHVKYATLNEEIFNEKRSKQINEMQVKYETEKRLQQILLLTKENELKKIEQKNQRIIFLASIALLLIAGVAFYIFYKNKKQKEIDNAVIYEKEQRSKAIIEAEEKERMRIARDLHDGVAQTMTAAKMQLEHFIESSQTPISIHTSLKNAFDLLVDSAKEVRSISHSMIPNALIKSGLVAAVRDFVNRMGTEKLKINLVVLGLNERLPENIETVIYRVLQELINNIIKHAQANEVTIQLIRESNEFMLMVEDNGKGFDLEKTMQQQGIGLKNITSRVEYLNGQVNYDTAVGKGTTVIIEIPL